MANWRDEPGWAGVRCWRGRLRLPVRPASKARRWTRGRHLTLRGNTITDAYNSALKLAANSAVTVDRPGSVKAEFLQQRLPRGSDLTAVRSLILDRRTGAMLACSEF